MGRAWPHAKPSTAHRQGEGRSSFQQVGWVGKRLPGPGWEDCSESGAYHVGSLGSGLPRGPAELGRQRSRPAGENTAGGGEAATRAALGGVGSRRGGGGERKWRIFYGMGVSVSQSPYPGGPGPSPLLPLQQAAPLLASWKSGKVTSESAPSQVPQEEEVHTPGRQGAAEPEEALGKDGSGGQG